MVARQKQERSLSRPEVRVSREIVRMSRVCNDCCVNLLSIQKVNKRLASFSRRVLGLPETVSGAHLQHDNMIRGIQA